MPSRRTKSSAINERISQAQKERTQLACVLCRSRRIKCDGRPGTCSRCLADRRSDCRYENVGSAERIAGRQRKRALRKQHVDEHNTPLQVSTIMQRKTSSPMSSVSTTSSSTTEATMQTNETHLHISNDDIPNSAFQTHSFENNQGDSRHDLYNSTRQRLLEGEEQENWTSPILLSSFSPPPPPMVGSSLQGLRISTQDLSSKSDESNKEDQEFKASSNATTQSQRRRITSSNRFIDDILYLNPMTASSSATNGSSMPTSWNSDNVQQQQQMNSYLLTHQAQQQNDLQYQMYHNQQRHHHQQQQQQQQQSQPSDTYTQNIAMQFRQRR